MKLIMKTSLSGPHYNQTFGDAVALDADCPFTPGEVQRFLWADYAGFVGDTDELTAWIAGTRGAECPAIGPVAPDAAPVALVAPVVAPAAGPAAAKPAAPARKRK